MGGNRLIIVYWIKFISEYLKVTTISKRYKHKNSSDKPVGITIWYIIAKICSIYEDKYSIIRDVCYSYK